MKDYIWLTDRGGFFHLVAKRNILRVTAEEIVVGKESVKVWGSWVTLSEVRTDEDGQARQNHLVVREKQSKIARLLEAE